MNTHFSFKKVAIALACVLSLPLLSSCGKEMSVDSHMQWHTVTLDFEGPMTSEDAELNPFTNYRLLVKFSNGDTDYWIRGFYAADGKAAESSADSGNIWRVRFTPDKTGTWTYQASLRKGEMIAISQDPDAGDAISLRNDSGSFQVAPSDKEGNDFRAKGRLSLNNNYFYFNSTDSYWMKGGAGSPENLLGYADFDGTYRFEAETREGEAKPTEELHKYPSHVADWKEGDPTWQNGKGKALIGGLNYLASKGMNTVYFLTLNIGGDGKDVWPYTDYEIHDRFDASKLDQWEIVFQHMQQKGILLHIVTQETENETMLDGGDTGPLRKLYYQELIARFGHHLALVWNLGEENGPAEFSPDGQNPIQQKAMASYLKSADPYQHPVLIHTHSWIEQKDHSLPPLLGHPPLDGLSFQINKPEEVNSELIRWQGQANEAGRPWTITMDEIGPWQEGALPDSVDPTHDDTRKFVLWGSLLGGAAGIEWYFGAHHPHNDLTAEDWRSRDVLWDQTQYAIQFMDTYIPYWEMRPNNDLTKTEGVYCLAKSGEIYAIYAPDASDVSIDLQSYEGEWSVQWYDPRNGGELQTGSVESITGSGFQDLGVPPSTGQKDWVALVKRNYTIFKKE